MKRDKLFIDTGGWIALMDSGDKFHSQAKTFYLSLDPAIQRITSSHVVGETYTWLRYKAGFPAACKFLSVIRQAKLSDRLSMVHDNADLLERAEQLLEDFEDQKLSYVDALSIAAMRNEGISRIFGFDHHFYVLKFELVPSL